MRVRQRTSRNRSHEEFKITPTPKADVNRLDAFLSLPWQQYVLLRSGELKEELVVLTLASFIGFPVEMYEELLAGRGPIQSN